MTDYYTTNSHYLTHTFLVKTVGECTFWTWECGARKGMSSSHYQSLLGPFHDVTRGYRVREKPREKLGAPRLKQTRVPNISPLTRGNQDLPTSSFTIVQGAVRRTRPIDVLWLDQTLASHYSAYPLIKAGLRDTRVTLLSCEIRNDCRYS